MERSAQSRQRFNRVTFATEVVSHHLSERKLTRHVLAKKRRAADQKLLLTPRPEATIPGKEYSNKEFHLRFYEAHSYGVQVAANKGDKG